MACHPGQGRRLKIDSWLARSSRASLGKMRGSEAAARTPTNCSRQIIAIGTDLSDASQTWLSDVAALMNTRSIKIPEKASVKKHLSKQSPVFAAARALAI